MGLLWCELNCRKSLARLAVEALKALAYALPLLRECGGRGPRCTTSSTKRASLRSSTQCPIQQHTQNLTAICWDYHNKISVLLLLLFTQAAFEENLVVHGECMVHLISKLRAPHLAVHSRGNLKNAFEYAWKKVRYTRNGLSRIFISSKNKFFSQTTLYEPTLVTSQNFKRRSANIILAPRKDPNRARYTNSGRSKSFSTSNFIMLLYSQVSSFAQISIYVPENEVPSVGCRKQSWIGAHFRCQNDCCFRLWTQRQNKFP